MNPDLHYRRQAIFFRLLAHILLALFGPLRFRGKDRFPKSGGVLILANHLADLDPLVLQAACPRPIRFMAKSELFEMKLLGPLLRYVGAFPVKRGEADRAALKQAADLAKAGYAVCVFPEGQLSEDGNLQPLKSGVSLIVRLAQCPVICCGIKNTNRVLPYGKLTPRFSFRRIIMHWGEPRTFAKDASSDEIMNWVESDLRALTGQ